MRTIDEAKQALQDLGAITFAGTTEKCNIITGYNVDGESVGIIYSSFDEHYKPIFVVRCFV